MDSSNKYANEQDLRRVLGILTDEHSYGPNPPTLADLDIILDRNANASNVVLELSERGLVSVETEQERTYVQLNDQETRNIIGEIPENINDYQIKDENTNLPPREYQEDFEPINVDLEIENLEKYIGTLSAFGRNPNATLDSYVPERQIQNQVGRFIEEELQNLRKWGYLEYRIPEQGGERQYRLAGETAQKIAVRSDLYIEERYDGRIHQFMEEFSEEDQEALTKKMEQFLP